MLCKKGEHSFKETCRIILGCLKSTSIEGIKVLLGLTPPDIRREITSEIERHK